jgi:aryl-alcohol dehydrogenase-like predicted oxidoreductase
MRYKLLGKSGLRVSEVSLGTMTFGKEWGWGSTWGESKRVFDCYVSHGGNFFDTANKYTKGTSERYLGELVGTERARSVIATKYTLNMDPNDPNSGGNHRKNLHQSLHDSLERLKTDYIDLLWVHAWDKYTPVVEMMRALDDVVRQGKVLYIGASNMPAWVVAKANTIACMNGWTPFTALQVEYSLVERTMEREYIGLSKEFGLGITAWSPLAMGVLTGKYLKNDAKDARFAISDFKDAYVTERNNAIAQVVVDIAKDRGVTPAQVALSWMKTHQPEVIPIIGSRSPDQLEENLKYLDMLLSDVEMARLEKVSACVKGYPYDFLESERMHKTLYGDVSLS